MYTFNPIATIPVDHTGLFLVGMMCVAVLLICLFNEPEVFFVWFFMCSVVFGIAYGVSYHLCDQTPQTFVNEQHIGKFVSFQPEGYREQSGKSKVDRHYMYVVYEVEGRMVILQTTPGMTYPKEVVLYKN